MMQKEHKWIQTSKAVLILAIIATFLWGSAVPSIKIGYQLFGIESGNTGGQMLFAGYRFFFAGLAILIILSTKEKQVVIPQKTEWFKLICLGFVQTFLQYFFYYIGMAHVTGVKGSIMNASSTLICVLVAHIYYNNDRLSYHKIIGCVIGFSGVILINLTKGNVAGGFRILGEGSLLGSAIVVSIGTVMNKEMAKQITPVMVAGYQLLFGGIGLVTLGYGLGGTIEKNSITGSLLFVYMVFISAMAFSIWSVLLKYHSMTKVSVYKFLIPVFGTLLSVLFLKESVWDIRIGISLLCVCLGIYFVNRSN